jgi:hypothetical protein
MNRQKMIIIFSTLGVLAFVFVFAGCGANDNADMQADLSHELPPLGDDQESNEALEEEAGERKGGRVQREMPEEAVMACEEQAEGDACTFTLTDPESEEQEMTGTCTTPPVDDGQLVCMSDDMPGPGGGGRLPRGAQE